MHKTLDYRSRDLLDFYFLGKGLGIISPPRFVYDFSKIILILYSVIMLTDQISMPGCLNY